jgi:UDP-N-acetylmuramoyl-tripeptide--D-alanyl-D-alanine ligase
VPAASRQKGAVKPSSPRRVRVVTRKIGFVCLALLVIVALLAWRYGGGWRTVRRLVEAPTAGRCTRRLGRAELDQSIALGQGFLLRHQRPEGNFDYEYDWRRRQLSPEDSQARQAGALWGLGLMYQDHPEPALATAIEKGIAFFDRHSVAASDGRRCVTYPGETFGATGTVALVALTHVEYLRSARAMAEDARSVHMARLGGYLEQLAGARDPDGLWYGGYSFADCRPSGEASSYSDGEALLALVKAAKYLGRREFLAVAREAADAGYRRNVEGALSANPDSDVTKGYYQWSSMAFYELYSSGWPDTERYGDWVLRLADWMIDVHGTLWRRRNTGYAYEGIVHAYEVARRRGDQARMAKYACVIDTGLEKLISWQLGGPIPSPHLRGQGERDPQALGGVQNGAFGPALRIDVTQHQMHAVLLARRYLYER